MRHVDEEEHTYNMILISGYLLEMNIAMPELLDAFLEDAGTSMAFALLSAAVCARG